MAGAQPRQGQRGVFAAGDHQMQRRWQLLEQEGDHGVHGRGAHEVVVVQDQDTGGGQGSQVVDLASDQNEKDRVASSASQANQAG